MNILKALIVAFALATTSAIGWADTLGLESSTSNSWDDILALESSSSSSDEFLTVEQAYHISIAISDDEQLIIDWAIEPDYYLYKHRFKLVAKTAETETILDGQYGTGIIKYDEYEERDIESFYNSTQITASLSTAPKQFELVLHSQGCGPGLCFPPHTQFFQVDREQKTVIETKTSQIAQNQSSSQSTTEAITHYSIWVYLIFALVGGLILNLMPCVFPVLSLKALTFASSSGSDKSHHHHGWAYTAGVIGSFIIVALFILAAKAAGEETGWGFQLQSPVFVAILMYLFLVMGLSLSGMLHVGTGLMGIGQGLTTQEGLRGSFFTGVLAAVVASPCTGPLMTPALGFALTQPASISLLIFIALGFGMALPFLLLSYSPKLAELLPKPGLWMEKLKELLAFPMYLTCAWLLFVFGRQVGMIGLFFLVLGALAIVFAIWLFQNQPSTKGVLYWFVKILGFSALIFAGYTALTSENFKDQTSGWTPFSQQKVVELQQQGHPVFVDFTADWCITCKANEALALSRSGFQEAVEKHNVALLIGDWTNKDPAISEVLKAFNRPGVPLYLMYSADTTKPPEVLPQLLTQELVIKAIERASQ